MEPSPPLRGYSGVEFDVWSSRRHIIIFISIVWEFHVRETGNVLAGFWWEELTKRDQLEELGMHGNILLKWIFKKRNGEE